METGQFKTLVQQKSVELYRSMPWRDDTRPYYVLVSELMLQQTQVPRVIPKFEAFISRFPDVQSLARASLADVLTLWQGLGYNRRAKYLHDAAKVTVGEYEGKFPDTYEALTKLPGVGKNTAGAILAYSFNTPSIFIETNIRTVYIHHFFVDNFDVKDEQIRELLTETIDQEHPREFYWALMDYGTWLKANGVRNLSQSRHYKKQAPLEGSIRQMRGRLLRALSERSSTEKSLRIRVEADARFDIALQGLLHDGLVERTDKKLHLTK